MHKDPIHYNMDHMKFRHQELGKIPLSVPSDPVWPRAIFFASLAFAGACMAGWVW